MKYMCGSCCLPTLIFFNPTLNIKVVFGEKIPKMGTFSDFFTIFWQNLIISLPTYPKFCWYATGTTHIFHLGLRFMFILKIELSLAILCFHLLLRR